jgi:hypothetical protein
MCEYLLQVRLADPDIVSDPSEYQKLAQSVAELDQVFSLLMMEFILLLVSTQLQWDVSLSTVRFYIALFFSGQYYLGCDYIQAV